MNWIIIMAWSLRYSPTSSSVKWALGSITTNKANGGDGIPAEIFQILKDDAIKVTMTYSICSKLGKLSSGHRTEKGSFHFNPKERQCQGIFKLLHNCIYLTHWQSNPQNSPNQASTIHEQRTSRCSSWIQKRQRNQRSNCQHLLNNRKSKRVPKNIYFCCINYAKTFDCVDDNKLWKILKEM